MKFKKQGNQLVGQFNLKKTSDKWIKDKLKTSSIPQDKEGKEAISRKKIFEIAGLPTNQTDKYFYVKNNSLVINYPEGYEYQAEFFFKELVNQAYKRYSKGDSENRGLTIEWIEDIAKVANDNYQQFAEKSLDELVASEVEISDDLTTALASRRSATVYDDAVLELFKSYEDVKEWAIKRFELRTLSGKEVMKLGNKYPNKYGKAKRGKFPRTPSTIDVFKDCIDFSASERNTKRFAVFLKVLSTNLDGILPEESNLIETLEKAYHQALDIFDVHAQGNSVRTLYNGNNSSVLPRERAIVFDWSIADGEDPKSSDVRHFLEDSHPHDYLLRVNSKSAEALHDALKPYDYLFADKFHHSFKIDQRKQDKVFRFNRSTEFSKAKIEFLKQFLLNLAANQPERISIPKFISEFKSNIESAANKLKEKQEDQKELLEKAAQEKEKLEERSFSFDKEQQPILNALRDYLNYKPRRMDNEEEQEKEDKKKESRRALLTNALGVDSISIQADKVRIGGANKEQLSIKEQEAVELIKWSAENEEIALPLIKEGKFHDLIAEYELRTREARYQSIRISEIGKTIDVRNDEQLELVEKLDKHEYNLVIGAAGTGKTFLALANAVKDVLDPNNPIQKILLLRPTVNTGNKKTGFLPGGIDEKHGPYVQGFIDNLESIFDDAPDRLKDFIAKDKDDEVDPIVNIQPIEYIRGRNIENTHMLIDEAQNLTQGDLRVIETRAGEGTRITLMGDVSGDQCDLPEDKRGAFRARVANVLYLKNKETIISVNSTEDQDVENDPENALDMFGVTQLVEVERSKLVNAINNIESYVNDNKNDIKQRATQELTTFIKKPKYIVVNGLKKSQPE